MAASLSLRPVLDADLPFMEGLYASTRRDELAAVPWPDAVKQAFLAQQFRAQHAHYTQHYGDAERLIVERSGQAIGRIYLHRRRHEHGVVDIGLLPEWRGHGFGTALMTDVIADARAAGKPVRIYVEKNNGARRLYVRLGFRALSEHGIYDLLEWRAAA